MRKVNSVIHYSSLVILISLFLSLQFSTSSAAPVYPPVVGGCNKSTFSNITINTPNVTVSKVKLLNSRNRIVSAKINRANSFLLSGISTGKVAKIRLVLPTKKIIELRPSIVSTGGLVCPTNVIFRKTGDYNFRFTIGKDSRSITYRVTG